MSLKVIPNFLRNANKIVALANEHHDLFVPRTGEDAHAGFIPGICSRFKTLKNESMTQELVTAIFADADWDEDTRDFWEFIQIQKYEPGDYIVPHRDSYRVRKLHLITLTSGKYDGLVSENDEQELVYIPDEAGQYVDFPYTAAHYVSPVRELRYSLVMGI